MTKVNYGVIFISECFYEVIKMDYDEFEKRVVTAYRFRELCKVLGLSSSDVAKKLGKSKAWASLFMNNRITCVQPKTYDAMRAALINLEITLREQADSIKRFVKKFNKEVSK